MDFSGYDRLLNVGPEYTPTPSEPLVRAPTLPYYHLASPAAAKTLCGILRGAAGRSLETSELATLELCGTCERLASRA